MTKVPWQVKGISDTVVARRTEIDIRADDLDHPAWNEAQPVSIAHLWSGKPAPAERHAEARIIWSETALAVRFTCRQYEPLVVSHAPQLEQKTIGLWERDVCEIFIAPDARTPENYFEFEVAPTGEWIDLGIRHTREGRETDWHYHSAIETAARIGDDNRILIALRLEWAAFGNRAAPRAGERWRANLFRCIGSGETRYLAWRPTRTAYTVQPNFHVPEAFGWLAFREFE